MKKYKSNFYWPGDSSSALLGLQYIVFALAIFSTTLSHSTTGNNLQFSAELKEHLSQLDPVVATPSFDIQNLNDQVVVVTFFASWCPPCRDEFKALNDLNNQLADEAFTIVALNVFEVFDENDGARMESFLRDTQPQFPVLKGTKQSLALFGDINRIPTLFAFNKNGRIAFEFIHARGAGKRSVDTAELLDAIRPLL